MQDLCSFLFQKSLRFLQADAVVSNGTQIERYAPTAVWNVKGFSSFYDNDYTLLFFLCLWVKDDGCWLDIRRLTSRQWNYPSVLPLEHTLPRRSSLWSTQRAFNSPSQPGILSILAPLCRVYVRGEAAQEQQNPRCPMCHNHVCPWVCVHIRERNSSGNAL